jgi:IrrE N-terminal-like domain
LRAISPSFGRSVGSALRNEIGGGGAVLGLQADRLLRAAGVNHVLPTPVDDLVAAAGLRRGTDDLFADDVLARAPRELQEAVRGLVGRVRAMLDRREKAVYVSPSITNEGRRSFQTLHEVAHEILPWQSALAYADDDLQLSWATRMRFEREANQTAAELLFQRVLFTTMAADYGIGIAAVVELSQLFGASIHAGFRRYVETHRAPVCGVVIDCEPLRPNPLAHARREAVASVAWDERFASPSQWPRILERANYPWLDEAHHAHLWGNATTQWRHSRLDNEPASLGVELFSNTYSTLVLIWVPQRERLKRRRALAPVESG